MTRPRAVRGRATYTHHALPCSLALTSPRSRRARARARHTKPSPPGLARTYPQRSPHLGFFSLCVSVFQQGQQQGDGEAAGSAVVSRAGGAAAAGGGVHGGRRRDHLAEAAPSRRRVGVGVGGVLRPIRGVGRVGGGRVVPALRLGAVPLHPGRVRVRALRPPRHHVPQVPVAARPALRPAEVRRRGAAEDVGRQDGDVRGRLAGAEPVRVSAVHAPRRGPRRADHPVAGVREDRPLLHRPLRGLQRDRRVLPDALPGGPRDGGVRPARPQAGHHRPGPRLARRRRARLRLLALVAAHRPHAALGLHPGGQHGGEGHGPHAGLHQGAAHLGPVGRRQPCPHRHQGLLPGDLALSLQGPGLGRVAEEDVHGGDAAAQRHGALPGRADPAAGDPARRAGRDGQARLPARLHLPVAAPQGRAPHQVRRRHLRRRLHALVRRRAPGHLERPLLRRAHRAGLIDGVISGTFFFLQTDSVTLLLV